MECECDLNNEIKMNEIQNCNVNNCKKNQTKYYPTSAKVCSDSSKSSKINYTVSHESGISLLYTNTDVLHKKMTELSNCLFREH